MSVDSYLTLPMAMANWQVRAAGAKPQTELEVISSNCEVVQSRIVQKPRSVREHAHFVGQTLRYVVIRCKLSVFKVLQLLGLWCQWLARSTLLFLDSVPCWRLAALLWDGIVVGGDYSWDSHNAVVHYSTR